MDCSGPGVDSARDRHGQSRDSIGVRSGRPTSLEYWPRDRVGLSAAAGTGMIQCLDSDQARNARHGIMISACHGPGKARADSEAALPLAAGPGRGLALSGLKFKP